MLIFQWPLSLEASNRLASLFLVPSLSGGIVRERGLRAYSLGCEVRFYPGSVVGEPVVLDDMTGNLINEEVVPLTTFFEWKNKALFL